MVREIMATQPDPLLREKTALATDFERATVREISFAEAQNLILANEWLGNMGTTEFSLRPVLRSVPCRGGLFRAYSGHKCRSIPLRSRACREGCYLMQGSLRPLGTSSFGVIPD